jgi:ABC-type iron transport system FetAB permease component
MKYLLLLFVLLPMPALAATLEWDRNTESDMKDYQVWACFTANCVVIKSAATLQPGTVLQPAVGVTPSYVLNIVGLEGNVAVSARDLSLNESALSVPAPFDAKGPGAPVAPRFR